MPQVVAWHNPAIEYPPAGCHAPAAAYPESPFRDRAPGANPVYEIVRNCLRAAGGDPSRYGSPSWSPFRKWIKPGNRVFILPNLVMHRRQGEPISTFVGKCTHGSLLRPVIDYAVLATGSPANVSFGNAPLQSCDYCRVNSESGTAAVAAFYRRMGFEVGPFDLRLLISKWTRYGALLSTEQRDPSGAVLIDLGGASLLEPLYRDGAVPTFAVGDYPVSETMRYHSPGRHVYAVHRRVLEADVIISIPKLKTHQKVGITCALKGNVGAIARKECLAHYRPGGSGAGDEFPRSTPLRETISWARRRADESGCGFGANGLRVAGKALERLLRLGPGGIRGGAWHGNDTAWRMTLDIARILRYAQLNGTLSETPIRQHLVLVDGIVGGEAEGPLRPEPRRAGVVVFGDDICAVDAACAHVMGFNPEALPLVWNSFRAMPFALTSAVLPNLKYTMNGVEVSPAQIRERFRPAFSPPKGWMPLLPRP